MRELFLMLVLGASTVLAQTAPAPQPSAPMTPTVRPPQGPASRAARHELFAREREQRLEERAEDRADAEKKRKDAARALKRMER